ncbi:unnamed protein product, partial [Rotaria socialis]
MQRWSKEIKLAKTVKLEKVRSEACRKETVAIWNVDESGFGDDPGKRSVIIKRDSKYTISCQPRTAGIYPYEPSAVNNEKLLGASSSSNDKSASVDDSAVIHQHVNRLTRSASCEQLSVMGLSITTTSLLKISDQSISIENGLTTITTTPVISPIDHIRMPSTILPMTTDPSILSSTIDSTIAIQQSSVPNSSNYDAAVSTDLSNNNNNMVVMDNSLVSTQVPINVLSNVISHGRPRKVTQQQQVLDEIDALSPGRAIR